jgi:hypothetical protein
MHVALLWSTATGIVSDIATTLYYTHNIVDDAERSRTVLEGLAESMSPGIFGFALLTVIALLTAVGRRRLDARGPGLDHPRS